MVSANENGRDNDLLASLNSDIEAKRAASKACQKCSLEDEQNEVLLAQRCSKVGGVRDQTVLKTLCCNQAGKKSRDN